MSSGIGSTPTSGCPCGLCSVCNCHLALRPHEDKLLMAMLEAHALLDGMESPKGMKVSPGRRERAMAEIEKACRIRQSEVSYRVE